MVRGNNATSRRGGRGSRGSPGVRGAARASGPAYTLASLTAELQERSKAGESQDVLVEWLHSLTSSLGIRMRYDEHTDEAVDDDEAVNADEPANADKPANDADEPASDDNTPTSRGRPLPFTISRGKMTIHLDDSSPREPPASGNFSHLASGDAFIGRIILSCDRRNARSNSPLCSECNGAVIDARTWTLLVAPPRAFSPRPPARNVDRALAANGANGTGHYDVIQVSDGTVVTLYRWKHPVKGPIWCLSSSNGYDVSPLRWMGPKSYAEIVHELLEEHEEFAERTGMCLVQDLLFPGDTRLDFADLDASKCYTIGFRHRNFHPMKADPQGIWNIQAADLATGTPEYKSQGLAGVPRQAVYTFSELADLAAKAGAPIADDQPITLNVFEHINRAALDETKAIIAKDKPSPPQEGEIHKCPFNYGFILRSRNPAATSPHSDVLIESSLLRRVRQLVYMRPPRQVHDELDESSRLEYNAIKAFLTPTDREDFIALFPEFASHFTSYREFIDNVVHLIIKMHRENAMSTGTRKPEEAQLSTQTKTVARGIYTHLIRHEKNFMVFNADAVSIVSDYVVRPEYALLYLKAIGLTTIDATNA